MVSFLLKNKLTRAIEHILEEPAVINQVHKQVRWGAGLKIWQETEFTPSLQLLIRQSVRKYHLKKNSICLVYVSFTKSETTLITESSEHAHHTAPEN